ncbi:MAG TPA: hypothetical protein VFM54_12980 [Micromonosporaceae bacterium]|nr:hypothetical protein [Micromonosporaceae bacterium]
MNDYFWRMSTIDSDVTDLLLAKPATVKWWQRLRSPAPPRP